MTNEPANKLTPDEAKKKKGRLSCLGCSGALVIYIIIAILMHNSASNTLSEGDKLWQDGKQRQAVTKYHDAEYGKLLRDDAGRAIIYQRCVECEWTQGNINGAKKLIAEASEESLKLQFKDPQIQAAVVELAESKAAEERAAAANAGKQRFDSMDLLALNSFIDGKMASADETTRTLWKTVKEYTYSNPRAANGLILQNLQHRVDAETAAALLAFAAKLLEK